jgi:hypothetical protein
MCSRDPKGYRATGDRSFGRAEVVAKACPLNFVKVNEVAVLRSGTSCP